MKKRRREEGRDGSWRVALPVRVLLEAIDKTYVTYYYCFLPKAR